MRAQATRDLRIVPRHGSLPRARHWVRDHARRSGIPSAAVGIVELLASELVANALTHGPETAVDVQVCGDRTSFTVRVTDGDATPPVVRSTGPEVPGGQGMRLVARLASTWGVDVHEETGKTVWFTVVAR